MKNKINIDFEIMGLEEAIENANRLIALLREAQQIINSPSREMEGGNKIESKNDQNIS